MQFIKATITANEELEELDDKAEIIIFRILQEFFTNTIKHSKASNLDVNVHYDKDKLVIHAKDDGVGFDHLGQSYQTWYRAKQYAKQR